MNGFCFFKNFLSIEQQKIILEAVDLILDKSTPYSNRMWNGKPFSVINSNAGLYGWFADQNGYHYSDKHPVTNQPWPEIPKEIIEIAQLLANKAGYFNFKPESCYINFYSENGSLGLHRDDSEQNLTAPIVSISLGDTALFHLGGKTRKDQKQKILLESGDCYVQGGDSRLYYHSVEKILPKTSSLLPDGGRINLTIRQVK